MIRGVKPSGVCQAPGMRTIIGFEEDIAAKIGVIVLRIERRSRETQAMLKKEITKKNSHTES